MTPAHVATAQSGPRPWGLLRVNVRIALGRPAFLGLLVANAVLGVVGGIAPTAIDGLSPGSGLLGGATSGFAFAVGGLPVLAALSAAALVSDRGSRRVGEALLVGGYSVRARIAYEALTAFVVAVTATLAAIPGGALVGLGDAWRQDGDWIGSAGAPPLVAALVAAVYLIPTAAALAAWAGTAARTFGVLVALVVGFVAALTVGGEFGVEWLRQLCAASPFGPLWVFVYDEPSRYAYSLPMGDARRLLTAVGWLASAGFMFARATRPAWNR